MPKNTLRMREGWLRKKFFHIATPREPRELSVAVRQSRCDGVETTRGPLTVRHPLHEKISTEKRLAFLIDAAIWCRFLTAVHSNRQGSAESGRDVLGRGD